MCVFGLNWAQFFNRAVWPILCPKCITLIFLCVIDKIGLKILGSDDVQSLPCNAYSQARVETHAKSLQKWAGFFLYFMLYFY